MVIKKVVKSISGELIFKKIENYIVFLLHHRFNVVFLLGGGYYYHKDHIFDFLLSQNSENFLLQCIKKDMNDVVFMASSRALGIIKKLVTDPLFQQVVAAGLIFALNQVWESLFNFLLLCSKDASELLDGRTMFDDSLVTKDKMYETSFQKTGNAFLDSLTQECFEIMCCSCSLMVKHQLKDQLPGGKYYKPSKEIMSDLKHCPITNIVSERDFATYDQKMTQKPTLSDIAACGVIMFNNKSCDWLANKSKEEIKKLVQIVRTNKHDRIKKYKDRKEQIVLFKIDKLQKARLEKEIKEQRLLSQREHLTECIQDVGLLRTVEEVEHLCKSKKKETTLKTVLQNQILFRKNVLCKNVPSERLFQIGESINNKYKSFNLENLIRIINFSSKSSEERASAIIESSVRDEGLRRELLESKKRELQKKSKKRKAK